MSSPVSRDLVRPRLGEITLAQEDPKYKMMVTAEGESRQKCVSYVAMRLILDVTVSTLKLFDKLEMPLLPPNYILLSEGVTGERKVVNDAVYRLQKQRYTVLQKTESGAVNEKIPEAIEERIVRQAARDMNIEASKEKVLAMSAVEGLKFPKGDSPHAKGAPAAPPAPSTTVGSVLPETAPASTSAPAGSTAGIDRSEFLRYHGMDAAYIVANGK